MALLALAVVGAFWTIRKQTVERRERLLADAEAEARRWYERLGGQVLNLSGDGSLAVRQALADAAERYHAAGAQLGRAHSVTQFRLARETAIEGLMYARAARVALGLDPGPPLPPLAAAHGAGELRETHEAEVGGQTFRAGPQPGPDTPYYYPGGRVEGRPVPAGWYSQPIWKPALAGAAGALGAMVIFSALLPPVYAFSPGDEQRFDSLDQGPADASGGDPGAEVGADLNGEVGVADVSAEVGTADLGMADFGGFDGFDGGFGI